MNRQRSRALVPLSSPPPPPTPPDSSDSSSCVPFLPRRFIPMFPFDCVLEYRVRSDGDPDLASSNLPLYILECKDKKVDGYTGDKLKIYNDNLQRMKIGMHLADEPPAVSSYLVILGAELCAGIVAVDKTVIVIRVGFTGDGGWMSYLIYDSVALSLRLVAPPETGNPSWMYTLSSNVSIARPCQGDAYALVHTGLVNGVDTVDTLYLWRPSSSLPPWSEKKKSSFPDLINWSMNSTHTEFSFNGHAYWVDLLCGVSYCRCDALFDDKASEAKFGGFISLPEGWSHHRSSRRVSQPDAYRTMGVVRDSFIRFVSIDGFQKHVKLEDRTMTVWKLLDHHQPWVEEHKLSLKTLWGFEGFGDMPKDLTPMYPHLSTNNTDVVYLVLGEYRENRYRWKFIATNPRYLLAVDMRKKIITSVSLPQLFPISLISCSFSWSLCQALVGPCNRKGNPRTERHWMKKRRR